MSEKTGSDESGGHYFWRLILSTASSVATTLITGNPGAGIENGKETSDSMMRSPSGGTMNSWAGGNNYVNCSKKFESSS